MFLRTLSGNFSAGLSKLHSTSTGEHFGEKPFGKKYEF